MSETAEGSLQQNESRSTLGGRLIAAREALGLTAGDIALSLRLSLRQIEALEQGDYSRLPGPTFVRGFIRNYAKVVKIDVEPLLQAHAELEHKERVQIIPVPQQQVSFDELNRGGRRFFQGETGRGQKFVAITVAGLLLLGFAVYAVLQEPESLFGSRKVENVRTETLPNPLQTTPLPAPAEAEKPSGMAVLSPLAATTTVLAPVATLPPALPAGGSRLKLTFAKSAWVEIRDAQGEKLYSQHGAAGSAQEISGHPPFAIVIGDAAQVALTFNGQPVDLRPVTNSSGVARLSLP